MVTDADAPLADPAPATLWQITLSGSLRAAQIERTTAQTNGAAQTITRFRTQKTAALFAYLALFRERSHPREILLDLFWPDEPLEAGRNALRVALSSLRKQLEPTGTPFGAVLFANRTHVHLNPDTCATDVARFEALARAGHGSDGLDTLDRAVALYGGDLLPGFYDDWVLAERERLSQVYTQTLLRLTQGLLDAGQYTRAAIAARKLLQSDPDSAAGQECLRRAEQGQTQSPAFVPALPVAPPPAVPITETAHTLPFLFTAFFGRQAEGEHLQALLAPDSPVRQVTLTGPGGVGKTRLALETARALAPLYGGAAWFVPLREEAHAGRIHEIIALSLGLPRSPTGNYAGAVMAALTLRPTLLVLDGFEQIASDGGATVLSLLQDTPTLRLLVTSRRRLEIPGEMEVALSPLATPPQGDAPPADLSLWPAVQLFVDRARVVQADFAVTPRTARDLIAVCHALEGLPLAIELAAARARTVSLGQMRQQLTGAGADPNARFALLTTRREDKPHHHRSLWATIAWSYSLLPPPLRHLFAQLSVFRGGWTIEAAQTVCAEPFAAEYLTQLRAHSLLAPVEGGEAGETIRFRLLDSLREFAAEQLTHDDAEGLATRHLAYFGRMAAASDEGLRGGEQARWLRRLDTDYDNIRAALAWCIAHFDTASGDGLRLATHLRQYWLVHGPLRESAETVTRLLAVVPPGDGAARAGAVSTLGALHLRLGDYEASENALSEGLRLFEEAGDRAGVARVLSNQGILWGRRGDLERGRAAQERSLAVRLEIGDRWGAAASYLNLGAVAHDMGDRDAARYAYEASLAVSREIGDGRGVGAALLNLANIAHVAGDRPAAREYYKECIEIARSQNNPASEAIALLNLGGLLTLSPGTYDAAQACFAQAQQVYETSGEQSFVGSVRVERGRLALMQNDPAAARPHLVAALDYPLTRAITCVALETVAEYAFATGDWERVVLFYGAVDTLRAVSQLPRQTAAHDTLPREQREAARTKLGNTAFNRLWAQGQALPLDVALDLARRVVAKKR